MNWKIVLSTRGLFALPLLVTPAAAQTASSQPAAPPVSYASVSQLNGMLSRWNRLRKRRRATCRDYASSIGRPIQTPSGRLSPMWNPFSATCRERCRRSSRSCAASPENLPSTFKLYRNLDALYDVLISVVESAGAFGSKDEFQSLQNDLSGVEKARHSFADRMETLAGSKETELARLRAQIQTAQAVANPPQPKKIIVDDTAPTPPKKMVKKKPVPKPAATGTNTGSTPATSAPKQ